MTDSHNKELPSKLECAMINAETVMQFPMSFPIKVMGLSSDHFEALVNSIAALHFPDFNERLTKIEYSKTGKYMSVTVTVNAQSNNSYWKIKSKSSSKSGNKAIGTAKADNYFEGKVVLTQTKTVTLTCSATGKLS